jgi:hypothetical protein
MCSESMIVPVAECLGQYPRLRDDRPRAGAFVWMMLVRRGLVRDVLSSKRGTRQTSSATIAP